MYFSVEIKSKLVVSAFISDNYFGKQSFVDNFNSLQGNVLFPFWLFQHSVPNKYNFLLWNTICCYVIVHLTSPKRALNGIAQINNFSCVRFAHFSTFNTCFTLQIKLFAVPSLYTEHHLDFNVNRAYHKNIHQRKKLYITKIYKLCNNPNNKE